ncbi:MAG: lysophospholipid acyltransferase family protein [Phycisphaerales bacterium]
MPATRPTVSRYDPRAPLSAVQSLLIQPAMYTAMRSLLVGAHAMPLTTLLRGARAAGRSFGGSRINRTRVDRAVERLRVAMPDLDDEERYELVMCGYEHLAMLGMELAVLPRYLTEDAWTDYVELGSLDRVIRPLIDERPALLLTGHCGNWEALGYTMALLGFRMHAIYRPLDLRPADRWLRSTRSRRGLELVDKFGAMHKLPGLLSAGESIAFVADQNAGDRGLQVPFFGRLTSSYKSIGLLAIQHRARVIVGSARRLPVDPMGAAPMRYRIEIHDRIDPEDWEGRPDPLFYITARYRRAIEQSVRNAPEQYLWMHRIWKSRPRHERLNKPFPRHLRRKLEELPWMTDEEVSRLVDRSDRDRAYMAENGITHFR